MARDILRRITEVLDYEELSLLRLSEHLAKHPEDDSPFFRLGWTEKVAKNLIRDLREIVSEAERSQA